MKYLANLQNKYSFFYLNFKSVNFSVLHSKASIKVQEKITARTNINLFTIKIFQNNTKLCCNKHAFFSICHHDP